MSGKPTVISTFAGCGGSSLGYKWAGFCELLAIDFEPHAIETFKLNFSGVDAWQVDIREVTAAAILKRTGIKVGELDVLDGSPPCQGFSTAGKRVVNDSRNDLAWEFIRLIEGLKPRAFVMENVSGMAKGGMKGRFNAILAGLKATGYRVEVRKLNAMYYGVPQSRERIIFIGMRDRQDIRWPKRQKLLGADTVLPELKGKKLVTWRNKAGKADTTRAAEQPAPTVLGTGICLSGRQRIEGVSVLQAIQSFPLDFQFVAAHKQHTKLVLIGNAVPPKMMQSIAEAILPQVVSDD